MKSYMPKNGIKVFAGSMHGLLLTDRGDLYGIGNNRWQQLTDTAQEFYEQPVLMARDVISAAAGGDYSIYVTRDGLAHWVNRTAEYLPEFSDVRAVYAESWYDRFWAVKNSGEVLCIGNNYDELLADRNKQLICQLPEVCGVKHGFSSPIQWLDNDSTSVDVKSRFLNCEEYKEAVEQYGEKNIELDLNETQPHKAMKALYFVFQKGLETYSPRIYRVNHWIYDPVVFHREWREDLPHRIYGRPVLTEEYLRGGWDREPGVKQISREDRPQLKLLEDGSVMAVREKLDWLKQPVVDIARGVGLIMLACANGDILWSVESPSGESEWQRMTEGRMNVCRIPEEA